jgi:hypothetical protein
MASIKWVKPSPTTLEYFERLAPGAPLETRKMFGLPSRFLNGYMLVGVFGDALMLHLSPGDRAECLAAGAKPFKPMGREMKAYVAIAPGTFEDHDLKWWIVRGMRHIATLPPRVGTASASRKSRVPSAPKRKPSRATKAATKRAKPKVAKKVVRKPAPKKAVRAAVPKPKKKPVKRRAPSPKKRPTPKKRPRRR